MFLNQDDLANTDLRLEPTDPAFWLNGERIEFDAISVVFEQQTDHYFSQVYQGKTLTLELQFNDGRSPWRVSVDNKPIHAHHYAAMFQLAHRISAYRQHKIQVAHKKGEPVYFRTRQPDYQLKLIGHQLSLIDHAHNADHRVVEVVQQNHHLIIKTQSGQTQRFALAALSDSETLLGLIHHQAWFKEGEGHHAKQTLWILALSLSLFLVVGLNGWFEWCCMDWLWVEIISKFASLILIFAVMFLPVLILSKVIWLNPLERKQRKRAQQLEWDALAGKLPTAIKPKSGWIQVIWALGVWALMVGLMILLV